MKSEEGFLLTNAVLSLAVRSVIGRLKSLAFLPLAIVMISSFALPAPAAAQGLAVSGNFYRQHFQLLPGETVSTPDIYLVVFNHEDGDIRVNLTTQSPAGVAILLDESCFTLASGEHQKVEVGVSAGTDAAPGEYSLAISAEVQPVEGKGVTIAGAAEQKARITILSAAAGQIGENTPPATPEYTIDRFSVAPGYHDGTDGIAFINIEYSIRNTGQPLEKASVILMVSFNDEPLERIEIVSLPTLEAGNTSGSYKYIPSTGWKDGAYAFELELLSQDKVYAQSPEEKLGDATPVSSSWINWNINWSLVGAVAGGLIIISLAVVFLRKRFSNILPGISALILPRKKRVYIENPEFAAISNEETGQPVTVKINYGINNKHKPVPDVRVELQVSKNDQHFENIALTTLNPLDKGVFNLEYDYAPAEGWQKDAAYKFNLALYIADKLHTVRPVSSAGPV